MSKQQAGFTITELLIVLVLVGLVGTMFFNFFNVNLGAYLKLQQDASQAATVASQSQRVASVVRSTTNLVSAAPADLVLYSYFYPSDTYVSLVHYYLSTDKKTLYCDVTPMTSNPPIGTPQPEKLKKYTIAQDFYLPASGNLFEYLDASQDVLGQPINDLFAVKLVRVNLSVKDASGTQQDLGLQVALRNRKTNL